MQLETLNRQLAEGIIGYTEYNAKIDHFQLQGMITESNSPRLKPACSLKMPKTSLTDSIIEDSIQKPQVFSSNTSGPYKVYQGH